MGIGLGGERSLKVSSHLLCRRLFVIHLMTLLALGRSLTFAFILVIAASCAVCERVREYVVSPSLFLSGVQQEHPGTSAGEFFTCPIPVYVSTLSTVLGSRTVLSHGL